MTLEQFHPGDRVAVLMRNRPPQMRKVKRVLKRFIQLDDDSRWSLNGMEYPRRDWPQQRITLWTKQHDRQCLIAEAVRISRNLTERLRESEIQEARELIERLRELVNGVDDGDVVAGCRLP